MTETKTQLTQGENEVEIVGYLATKDLVIGVSKKGATYIRGHVDVKVGENETHRVKIFEMEKFKSGKDNPAFKGLKTVMETKLSIADIAEKPELEGRKPSYVRIGAGELSINDYYQKDTDEVVSYPEIKGKFISEVKTDASGNLPKPSAMFKVAGILDKKKMKEQEDGTAFLEFTILNIDFFGNIIPVNLVARDKAAEYIDSNYEAGDGLFLHGKLRNYYKRDTKTVEMENGFGEPTVEVTQVTVREWEVVGGHLLAEGKNNYDDTALIRQAKATRDTMLASKKEEYLTYQKEKGANQAGNSVAGAGSTFGGDGFDLDKAKKDSAVDLGGLFG